MCSAPKMPKMKDPEPLPAPEPLPQPQQAPPARPVAPVATPAPVQAAPPLPPPVSTPQAAPPPQAVTSTADADQAIIKRKKSKRKELQQASSGTDALRIPLQKSIGSTPSGSTGSSGLNIPR